VTSNVGPLLASLEARLSGKRLAVVTGMRKQAVTTAVRIPAGSRYMNADLRLPDDPRGLAVFLHASGSARLNHDHQLIPRYVEGRGYATLVVDLLTMGEEASDVRSGAYHLDIPFLSDRACLTLLWIRRQPDLRGLPLALVGTDTASGAVMVAAAAHADRLRAVISVSGRPDLADGALDDVRIPTLLIAGALDTHVVDLNREALTRLHGIRQLDIVDGARADLMADGSLARVANDTADWLDGFVAKWPERADAKPAFAGRPNLGYGSQAIVSHI